MKTLYQARNASDADDLRRFLWVRGIDAAIDAAAETTGASADRQPPLNVLVDDEEFDRASMLLAQFTNRLASHSLPSDWTCLACAEVVEPEFDNCTNCGVRRGDVAPSAVPKPMVHAISDSFLHNEIGADEVPPIESAVTEAPGANRSSWSLWVEVLAVFALTKPIFGGHSLFGFAARTLHLPNNATNFYAVSLLHDLFTIVVVLGAIRFSGDQLSAFGIKKPKFVDLFTGGIVCIVSEAVARMGLDIFRDVLKSMFGEDYVHQLLLAHRHTYPASGGLGLIALLALAISTGLSEELAVRSYLIPRLERLVGSTWASVGISAVVFALLHWYNGIFNAFNALLMGIVAGVAFVWTRRLWPVAIAHALHDFSVFLATSR